MLRKLGVPAESFSGSTDQIHEISGLT